VDACGQRIEYIRLCLDHQQPFPLIGNAALLAVERTDRTYDIYACSQVFFDESFGNGFGFGLGAGGDEDDNMLCHAICYVMNASQALFRCGSDACGLDARGAGAGAVPRMSPDI